MAKDADGNYYYDAGTINEELDNFSIVEDENGGFVVQDESTQTKSLQIGVGEQFSGGGLEARTSEPDNPSDGDVWLRTDTRELHFRSNGVTYSFDQPKTFSFALLSFEITEQSGQVLVGVQTTKRLQGLDVVYDINSGSETGNPNLSSFSLQELQNGWLYTYPVSGVLEGDTVSATLNSAIDRDNTKDVGEGQTAGPFSVPDVTAPSISNYSVTNPTSQDVQVSFDSNEQLSEITAEVSGAESGGLLGEAGETGFQGDWSESGSGPYTYTATYPGSTDGDYTVTLISAVDDAGNNGATDNSQTVTVSTA
jgi:hypothetical protein